MRRPFQQHDLQTVSQQSEVATLVAQPIDKRSHSCVLLPVAEPPAVQIRWGLTAARDGGVVLPADTAIAIAQRDLHGGEAAPQHSSKAWPEPPSVCPRSPAIR